MNHTTAEEQNLAELYVAGRLSGARAEEFEEHFVDCPRCLDRIEWTEDLQGALRRAAAEEAARVMAGGIWTALLRRPSLMALAAALPAILLLALLWPQMKALETRARTAEKTLAERPATVLQPEISPPILILARTREAAEEEVTIRAGERRRLAFEVDSAAHFEGYLVRLSRPDGDRLWQGRVEPNPWSALEIVVPADYLAAGRYRLEMLGLNRDGSTAELATFRLRAVP